FFSSRVHVGLRSFPTRRSSDLGVFVCAGFIVRSTLPHNSTTAIRPPVPSMANLCSAQQEQSDVRSRRCQSQLPRPGERGARLLRSEEHTSELQSRENLVCRLLL